MTVIAWDGNTLAADRQMSIAAGYCKNSVVKIERMTNGSGQLLAATGNSGYAMRLRRWYADGADPQSWPQPTEGASGRLVVIHADKRVFAYECGPYPWEIVDPFFAMGSGAEVAIGALAMGATARRAVEIASQFAEGCGNGVDELTP